MRYLLVLAMIVVGFASLTLRVADAPSAQAANEDQAVPKVTIAVKGDAYVDMPIWVNITFTNTGMRSENMHYPFTAYPWFTWGHDFEVMKDGKLLPKRKPVLQGGMALAMLVGGSSAPPTSPTGRLPLHILYRIDQPGTYRVRYVLRDPLSGVIEKNPDGTIRPSRITLASEWMELEVKPFTPEQRKAWQQEQLAHPPTDRGLLVGDYLPSLLASPDNAVIQPFLDALYHPDTFVQSCALKSLGYFEKETLPRELPKLIKQRGPTSLLGYALSWHRQQLQPRGSELVDILIPYLRSESPVQAEGAVTGLSFMRAYDWAAHPDIPQRIEQAMFDAVPHLRAFNNTAILNAVSCFLGSVKSDRSRSLLWEIADTPAPREQALIALCWLADPRDLPRLGNLLLTQDPAVHSLPYHLRRAYGEKAVPYLQKAKTDAPDNNVRDECARELTGAANN